jgi:hypothetical protein
VSARRARALRKSVVKAARLAAGASLTAEEVAALRRTYRHTKRAWGALSHPERRRLLRRRGAGGRGR